MSELYFNPIGGYGLVCAVALVLVGLLWFGPERARTTPRQRLALTIIRLLVILLVLLAMLRPARVVTEIKKQTATLVVLADRSRSMLITDGLGGEARWESLKSVLADAEPLLRELDESLSIRIKLYAFDSQVHALEFNRQGIDLGEQADGQQSAIGAALEEVLRREAGERLLGVLLMSDGAQRAYAPYDTPPQTAVRRLADLGYPLYTFAFGQARGLGQSRDVAIKDLVSSPTVFVKNQFDVAGMLRVDGFSNQQIPVQMLFEKAPGKMEVVAAAEMRTGIEGEQLPVELSYVPEVPGQYKVTLRAARQPGELVTTNNELSTFVTVLKGGISALYLESALRVEQRFLRQSIDASPDIKLDFLRIDDRDRSRWPTEIGDRFDPGKYDVYLLGDLDSSALKTEDWQKLADRIDQGAGLMMIGGYHSFGPGGYLNTPLADVLPIGIGQFERQNFNEKIRESMHWDGPLRMVPTRVGEEHPLLQLAAPKNNRDVWAKLPPLEGANRFESLKPAANVLAESEPPQNAPLLVAGGWGNGRVLAFAGDSTWHWWLEGFQKEHRRFWRQVILWLARKDQTSEGNVWIKLEQLRYEPGGRVQFSVGADNSEGEPLADAQFEVAVILPDATRRIVPVSRQGAALGAMLLDTQQPGDYTIELTATHHGEHVGTARARFLVFEQDLELDNPAADPGLLASLAGMTADVGGQSLAAEELPGLLKQLLKNPPDLEVETQQKRTYWDTWTLLLLFVGLISTEWFFRKKWGLV